MWFLKSFRLHFASWMWFRMCLVKIRQKLMSISGQKLMTSHCGMWQKLICNQLLSFEIESRWFGQRLKMKGRQIACNILLGVLWWPENSRMFSMRPFFPPICHQKFNFDKIEWLMFNKHFHSFFIFTCSIMFFFFPYKLK